MDKSVLLFDAENSMLVSKVCFGYVCDVLFGSVHVLILAFAGFWSSRCFLKKAP